MKWKPASIEELRRRGLHVERAREPAGTFRADDPVTPENEAWKVEKPAKPKRRRKKE